jgi:hypothetical protein
VKYRHKLSRRLRALFVVSVLVLAACSADAGATSLPDVQPEELAAAAINGFAEQFPQYAGDAPVVRVPLDMDVAEISGRLSPPRKVTTAELRSSKSGVDVAVYWEVAGVIQERGYWRVGIMSVNGSDFVSVSLFFRVNEAGDIERADPADLGLTPTTSVS